jgi:hypothetical protein
MKQSRFSILFGTILAKLFTAFCVWHSPRQRQLTGDEIDHYMATIEKLPAPAEGIQAFTSRIRPWAEADDGKPVFMLNLLRFHPQLHTFAGAPEFKGTPEEANAYYEKSITPMWLSHAAYPIFAGTPQSKNLINIQPEKEWGRVVVCRYPSRRAFLKLLSDPSYVSMEPYKFIATEIDLVPVSCSRLIPDLRLIVGGSLLVLFFAGNWLRAARRSQH